MSVTITITDPTEEEARRVADYLMELGGYSTQAVPGNIYTPSPEPAVVTPPVPVIEQTMKDHADPATAFGPTDLASHMIPVVPAAPNVLGVELDAAGMPWDGRIHSDTKSKVGGGYWRTRRGADPAVVAAVTAELKAAMGAPLSPVLPGLANVVPNVPVPPPFVASAAPSVPPVPTTPVAESAGAAPTVSPSNTGAAPLDAMPVPPVSIAVTTFPQLMMAITKGIAKGTFTQPDVVKAIEGVGLASIPMLASRPDLIPAVATALGV